MRYSSKWEGDAVILKPKTKRRWPKRFFFYSIHIRYLKFQAAAARKAPAHSRAMICLLEHRHVHRRAAPDCPRTGAATNSQPGRLRHFIGDGVRAVCGCGEVADSRTRECQAPAVVRNGGCIRNFDETAQTGYSRSRQAGNGGHAQGLL